VSVADILLLLTAWQTGHNRYRWRIEEPATFPTRHGEIVAEKEIVCGSLQSALEIGRLYAKEHGLDIRESISSTEDMS